MHIYSFLIILSKFFILKYIKFYTININIFDGDDCDQTTVAALSHDIRSYTYVGF